MVENTVRDEQGSICVKGGDESSHVSPVSISSSSPSSLKEESIENITLSSRRRDVSIPKIIMQTWKTKDIPAKWQDSKPSFEKFMPGWKHVLMTDEDNRKFVTDFYPDFLPYYDAFPYNIQKADAIRYLWLHKHGGLYADCDMALQKPLDELFIHGDVFFMPSPLWKSTITNSLMASVPGHPIWLEMIEEMKKTPKGVATMNKELETLGTTGPNALTRVLDNTRHPYVRLPTNVLGCGRYCGYPNDPNSYIRELEGSSWIPEGMKKLYQTGYCYRWPLIILAVVIVVVLLVLLGYWLARLKYASPPL